MTKRRRVFVEKFFYNIIAYTHDNISLKKFLCQCAHIPWNLIVSIGREYMADPVVYFLHFTISWIHVLGFDSLSISNALVSATPLSGAHSVRSFSLSAIAAQIYFLHFRILWIHVLGFDSEGNPSLGGVFPVSLSCCQY